MSFTFDTRNSTYEVNPDNKTIRRNKGKFDALHDFHEDWFEYSSIVPQYGGSVIVIPSDELNPVFITSHVIGDITAWDIGLLS